MGVPKLNIEIMSKALLYCAVESGLCGASSETAWLSIICMMSQFPYWVLFHGRYRLIDKVAPGK